MLESVYKNKLLQLVAQNGLLKFIVLIIGTTVLWNTHQTNKALHYQKTILVPSGLDRKVTISSDGASDEYMRIFGRTITNLAFNFSNANIRGQYGELLQYFTAESFPQAKQAFYELADSYERMRITQSYIISKPIEVDQSKHIITVSGIQRQWVENNFLEPQEKTYMITYQMIDGRFGVVSIDERLRDDARMRQEREAQNAKARRSGNGF